jgi:hypothetical protein
MEPISRVFSMAGLDNTMRRLVVGGTPVVMGLHAMGETVGRGLSLPLSGTVDLLDTISAPRAGTAAYLRFSPYLWKPYSNAPVSGLMDHNERVFWAQGRSYGASNGALLGP